jgi:hypothetical protein
MALLTPFLIAPVGLVLMLTGVLGDPHLPEFLSIGYLLAWTGFFAALPSALYIVVAWLIVRPRTDGHLLWTLVLAPPICGIISQMLEGYFARGSFLPREGDEYFFLRAATLFGYVFVSLILLAYVLRRRTPPHASKESIHT